ncbi:MAG: hypothetical protein QOH70_3250 [Blastocatellia bacterium]|jgi:hypothetical protein|nr:hypothetical protein [Blastocatellia bacterium]
MFLPTSWGAPDPADLTAILPMKKAIWSREHEYLHDSWRRASSGTMSDVLATWLIGKMPVINSLDCGLRSPRTLLTAEPLFGDPVLDITGTMDEGDPLYLTCCEEANDIQVDQTHFVQVERDARPPGLYLRFQFFDMLQPHAANQP